MAIAVVKNHIIGQASQWMKMNGMMNVILQVRFGSEYVFGKYYFCFFISKYDFCTKIQR